MCSKITTNAKKCESQLLAPKVFYEGALTRRNALNERRPRRPTPTYNRDIRNIMSSHKFHPGYCFIFIYPGYCFIFIYPGNLDTRKTFSGNRRRFAG